MKVAVVAHSMSAKGGMERIVTQQVSGLRRRGHQVELVAGPDLGSGRTERAAAAALLMVNGPLQLLRADAVVAHYPPAPWIAAATGTPFIYYFHHPFRAVYPSRTQSRRSAFRIWSRVCQPLKGIDRAATHRATVVAVPSPRVACELELVYGLSGAVVPGGVDGAVYRDLQLRRERHLLFVGRATDPYKHVEWAVNVAMRLNVPLRVIGAIRAKPPLGMTSALVELLPPADDQLLVEEYNRAAVLLFPSEKEDFGIVPLEAMACGLPVVAFDDGCGPSYSMSGESGGILVDAYDLDAFTLATQRLLDDPDLAVQLGERGVRTTAKRFSWESHIDAIEELLFRVVDT